LSFDKLLTVKQLRRTQIRITRIRTSAIQRPVHRANALLAGLDLRCVITTIVEHALPVYASRGLDAAAEAERHAEGAKFIPPKDEEHVYPFLLAGVVCERGPGADGVRVLWAYEAEVEGLETDEPGKCGHVEAVNKGNNTYFTYILYCSKLKLDIAQESRVRNKDLCAVKDLKGVCFRADLY
jgi:hypothetical protein